MEEDNIVVVASRNRGKLAEIEDILNLEGWRILSIAAFPEIGAIREDGGTFEENARIKAIAVADAVGMVAIADDSGLDVDALGGQPGVNSARFAGEEASDEDNNKKLLELMDDVPPERRAARFVCVICAFTPQGDEVMVRGECEGLILEEPRGGGGFGYDPLFYHPPSGKTFAEMTPEEKNRVSHRFKALSELKKTLPKVLEEYKDW